MKLKYSILWFDDNEDYLESLDEDYIKEEFLKQGFYCDIKFVTDPQDFKSESPYKRYDLIVVDYSLDPYDGHGEDFIRLVRDQQVLTDVVFYSSHPSSILWDAIREKELEGIFISNRNSCQDKIIKVSMQSISKVLDLENVRGIVMAEVGSNDEVLSKIVTSSFLEIDEYKQGEIIEKYIDIIEYHSGGMIEKASKIRGTKEIKMLLEILDSSKKWNLCQSLAKCSDTSFSLKGKGDYFKDVLDKRNKLAHGVPKPHEGDSLIFTHGKSEYIFSDGESRILRSSLMKYSDLFKGILETYE